MTTSTAHSAAIAEAASRLQHAADTRTPCAPIRDLVGSASLDLAYAIQQAGIERRVAAGSRVIGRKIGLTSPVVQAQLGVDQPDLGVLLDDMRVEEGQPVPMNRLLQPKAEAEIGFVLAEDLVDGDLSPLRIRRAIAHAAAALEIVDSRIADWDISLTDTVADNASSGLFVLGSPTPSLDDFEPHEVEMTMTLDGTVVSTGTGAACLGDPLNAVAWLAATARNFGDPLRAGQVILSGALGPMAAVGPGSLVYAEITAAERLLGSVSARFDTAEEQS